MLHFMLLKISDIVIYEQEPYDRCIVEYLCVCFVRVKRDWKLLVFLEFLWILIIITV